MVWDGVGGNRRDWAELPELVARSRSRRARPWSSAASQPGGFSPGLAARLLLADGRRVFAKAVSGIPFSVDFYRREADIAGRLPARVAAPRLLWSGGWGRLDGADLRGRRRAQPAAAVAAGGVAAGARRGRRAGRGPHAEPGRPAGRSVADPALFSGWRALAADPALAADLDPWARDNLDRLAALEADWPSASAGDTLVHGDLRADNILLAGERVLFVDWPHAAVGAPWVDLLCMLPSVAMQGGPDPVDAWCASPLAARADPAAVDSVLAALTGFFLHSSLLPAPPELPRLRRFQRLQGEPALAWLRSRLR